MDKKPKIYLIVGCMFLLVLGIAFIIAGVFNSSTFFALLGIALTSLVSFTFFQIIKAKIQSKKGDSNNTPDSGSKSSGKSRTTVIIALIVIAILFAMLISGGFESSGSSRRRSSSSNKSYAEQYGYSPEDFYYKGSDGLWYKK